MKIILNVPYEEKDLVKALHGRWDGKSWYIPEGVDYHPFRIDSIESDPMVEKGSNGGHGK